MQKFAILAVSRTIALLPPPLILLPALQNILSFLKYDKAQLRKGLQTRGTDLKADVRHKRHQKQLRLTLEMSNLSAKIKLYAKLLNQRSCRDFVQAQLRDYFTFLNLNVRGWYNGMLVCRYISWTNSARKASLHQPRPLLTEFHDGRSHAASLTRSKNPIHDWPTDGRARLSRKARTTTRRYLCR